MSTRRDFLMTSAGIVGAVVPTLGRSQALPCPPPELSATNAPPTATACVASNAPAYITSMSPFQVRSLGGNYAPANGTSTLRSIMPSIWAGNDDILRPWSGGAKSTTGTKAYIHGGGHTDSSNNGLYSFDFAGTARPTGWTVEYAGATGVSGDIAVGATGDPASVHTYDGMIDVGASIYRVGGAIWVSGSIPSRVLRYDKASGRWTRLPNYPAGGYAGMVLANTAAGKILALERESTYNTYAFYRMTSNNWSALKSDSSTQWNTSGAAAWDPATNTGLTVGNNGYGATAFSIAIDWSAETIVRTSRSLPSMGSGAALVWDPTRRVYWCWGSGSSAVNVLYEINPTTYAVTQHALSGDSVTPESNTVGHFGRWVFMDAWRAIGSVANRSSPAYVIRLP